MVAIYRNRVGPTVMVRTELDALPMEEKTGLPYASRVKALSNGLETYVAHSCGHDIHMASWIGSARALVALRGKWQGTLMFVAQPAEELVSGARAMLADGLFTRFPALIVDILLIELVHIFFILVGSAAALGLISGDMELSPLDVVLSLTAPIMLLYFFIFCAYFTFFHAKGGQTPGKMLLHIRVLSDTIPALPLSAPQAFFRALLFTVSCFFFYFSILMVNTVRLRRAGCSRYTVRAASGHTTAQIAQPVQPSVVKYTGW